MSLTRGMTPEEAVPLILDRFGVVAQQGSGVKEYGRLDFLPSLYAEGSADSCLTVVTQMFARAWHCSHQPAPQDDADTSRLYGRALRSINQALGKPSEMAQDGTIAAVWLISIYEVLPHHVLAFEKWANVIEILVGSPQKWPTPGPEAWNAHAQGLISLLRARGEAQFTTRRGRHIFWVVYGIVVRPTPRYSQDLRSSLMANRDSKCDASAPTSPALPTR